MCGGHLEAGSVERDAVEARGELLREHGFDAGERRPGRLDGFSAAPGFDEACAEHKRGEFFRSEHEWRKVEVAAKRVADASLAFDGLAGELEVANVAIDGALGDLKPLGKCVGGLQASRAQHLHDAEEAVGTPHACTSCGGRELVTTAVQANVVAFRISDAGEEAEAAGDLCARNEDL